jgi:hypothetical protein
MSVALASSWVMTAMGWAMQLLNYPAFLWVEPKQWPAYHWRHCAGIGPIVGPAMIAETASALILAQLVPEALTVTGAVLAGFALIWTFAASGPIHSRLSAQYDENLIRRLIRSNLPRTLAWSAHAIISLWLLVR